MNRRVSFALALLGVTALVVGSGGYSDVTADRGVSIAVVNDENAYLGVIATNRSLDNGNHSDVTLLTLENQVGSEQPEATILRVRGTRWEGSPPKVSNLSVERGETASETEIVADRVVCANNGNGPGNAGGSTEVIAVTLKASMNDEDITVRLSRKVEITCSGDPNGPDGSTSGESNG